MGVRKIIGIVAIVGTIALLNGVGYAYFALVAGGPSVTRSAIALGFFFLVSCAGLGYAACCLIGSAKRLPILVYPAVLLGAFAVFVFFAMVDTSGSAAHRWVMRRIDATSPERDLRQARFFVDVGIGPSLSFYKHHNGSYPSTEQGLKALLKGTASHPEPFIEGPLIDPWGHPYGYRFPGTIHPNGYDAFSKGPNGVGDGTDEDDILNKFPEEEQKYYEISPNVWTNKRPDDVPA
jgi:hypothetical protein